MTLMQRIENRLAQPGDSETTRSQKSVGALVLLFAAPLLLLNALSNFSVGLNSVGLVFVFFALLLAGAFVVELLFPAHMRLVGYVVSVGALGCNLAAHLLSGGTTGGSFYIGWAVLTPLLAAFLLDRRALVVALVPFLLVVVLVVLLEPWALQHMPEVYPVYSLTNYAISLAVLGIMITMATLFLMGEIENYRKRADDLLLNILPGSIATRLKEGSRTIADGYSEVSVLFADIVDFTALSADADPVAVVQFLNDLFSQFDDLADRHGLEKIKTIGDAYMAASGLPEPRADHVEAIVAFAEEMLATVERHPGFNGRPIQLRIGINSGPVVAGVIGRQKFIYDLWGDAVNVASRMESHGLANQIQVTQAVKDRLEGQYRFSEREAIAVKGKGLMVTYLLQPLPAPA